MRRSNRTLILSGIATLAGLGIGLGVMGTQTRISGAVMTGGVIQSQFGPQILQTEIGGVVAQVLTENGEHVQQGDVLVRLNGDQHYAETAIISGQIDELKARAARLRAERDNLQRVEFGSEDIERTKTDETLKSLMHGQARLFHARHATVNAKVKQLVEQKRQIENEIIGENQYLASVSTQLQLVQTELDDAEMLRNKGFSPASRVAQLKREIAGLTGTQGKLNASIARSRGKIVELNASIAQIHADYRERAIAELRDIDTQIVEKNEQRRLLLNRIETLDLRATRSGVVMLTQDLSQGSVIRPAQPLMTIVPVEGPFKVTAKLSPRDIDEVHLGQTALLRFTTLGKRDVDASEALVTAISPNTVARNEAIDAYYDVELEFPKTADLTIPLGNGLPVEVFFQTTPRSPVSYLLGPFTDYFSKALRD